MKPATARKKPRRSCKTIRGTHAQKSSIHSFQIFIMTKRQDDYYDAEAGVYSHKRYPGQPQNYIQFLFTHRRDIVLSLLGRVIAATGKPRALFEMGCADGVLLRAIAERYPGAFEQMIGSDVSRPMLEEARKLTHNPSIRFAMRDELPAAGAFTCAMEVGVGAIVLDTLGELALLSAQLGAGGYLICSIAGRDSIAARWGSTAADRALLKPYREYEKDMKKLFTIEAARSCGTHVPLLWRMPFVGRALQPLAEVAGVIFPELAHERVYLLKKK
jgi:SAM-dependent methyltransferase